MEIIRAGNFVLGCSKEVKDEIERDVLHDLALMAGRQNGKTSQIQRNLPYPKLDMKSLEDFISRLQNSESFKNHEREREVFRKICTERLEKFIEATNHKLHYR